MDVSSLHFIKIKGIVVDVKQDELIVALITPQGDHIPPKITLRMENERRFGVGDWLIILNSVKEDRYSIEAKITNKHDFPLVTKVDHKRGIALLNVKLLIRESGNRLYGHAALLGNVFIPNYNHIDKDAEYEADVCWAPPSCRKIFDFNWLLMFEPKKSAISSIDEEIEDFPQTNQLGGGNEPSELIAAKSNDDVQNGDIGRSASPDYQFSNDEDNDVNNRIDSHLPSPTSMIKPDWDVIDRLCSNKAVFQACYKHEPKIFCDLIGILLSASPSS